MKSPSSRPKGESIEQRQAAGQGAFANEIARLKEAFASIDESNTDFVNNVAKVQDELEKAMAAHQAKKKHLKLITLEVDEVAAEMLIAAAVRRNMRLEEFILAAAGFFAKSDPVVSRKRNTRNEKNPRLNPLRNRERWSMPGRKRRESLLNFIERVYPDRREYDLTVADFIELDKSLYGRIAAARHKGDFSIPESFGLPMEKEARMAKITSIGLLADFRLFLNANDIERLIRSYRYHAQKAAVG